MKINITAFIILTVLASAGYAKPAKHEAKSQAASSATALLKQYHQSISLLESGKTRQALNSIPSDTAFNKAALNTDRLQILRARAFYQNNQFDKAIQEYSLLPKNSDLWITAVEERAHTYGKMGQYENAIADFTTLFSPVFIDFISPEAFFTKSLTQLRLCQFAGVYETLEQFKNLYLPKIDALEKAEKRQADEVISDAVNSLKAKGLNINSYATLAKQLPRNFHMHYEIQNLIATSKGELPPSQLKKISQKMSLLAKEDLTDIRVNLNKLKLVEAEIMQRLHIVENFKKDKRSRQGTFTKQSGQIEFPFNGEIWLDELDAYKGQASLCPNTAKGV